MYRIEGVDCYERPLLLLLDVSHHLVACGIPLIYIGGFSFWEYCPVAHPLVDVIVPEALQFTWHEHCHEVKVGPFTFPGDVSIPVAQGRNELAREGWLSVPYVGRPPIPAGLDGEGSDTGTTELLRACLEGHLQPAAPDYQRLVDEIARCLLIHATFGDGGEWHSQAQDVFARADDGAALFEILVRRAKGRVGEGVHFLEKKDGEQALYEYLLARLLYFGAHLISPTTPGVLYEMGVLSHDLAHQLEIEDEKASDQWKVSLAREASTFLSMSLADDAVRDETPALFLLGANRETVGELKVAVDAYKRFLESPAAKSFPTVADAAQQRLNNVAGESGGLAQH
jgi:hypothetical protein